MSWTQHAHHNWKSMCKERPQDGGPAFSLCPKRQALCVSDADIRRNTRETLMAINTGDKQGQNLDEVL
jgi:hypothetical protein